MSVPADHVPQDAAFIDGCFMQVPCILSTVKDAEGFVIQPGAGSDVGFAIIAFDVAVAATGDSGEFLFGQCNDLLFILIHHFQNLPFVPALLAGLSRCVFRICFR